MERPFTYQRLDHLNRLAAHEGLVVVLFINKGHQEIADGVGALYERYLRFVGPGTLRWMHDRGVGCRPFTELARARVRSKLSSARAEAGAGYQLTLQDTSDTEPVPSHRFRYIGAARRASFCHRTRWASSVEVWLPASFPEVHGYGAFVEAVAELAECVPFSCGYCSLSINYEDWFALQAESCTRGLARRHPGLDFKDTPTTSCTIGDAVRGAYWLTLLGETPLEQLALDAPAIQAALGSEFTVLTLPNGVLIRAGEKPEVGDVNRGQTLPLVRRVAALIEPVQFIQTEGIMLFEAVDDFVAWQKRHLE